MSVNKTTIFGMDARKQVSLRALMSTSAVAVAIAIPTAAMAAAAPQTAADEADLEEVVVTGSRIVREGYEAPTPMAVISTESLERNAEANIAQFLVSLPALTGSGQATNRVNGLSPGNGGVNDMNLRSLGANRTLVLLDGQRGVGSLVTGVVDISSLPQQLISRVDVVTGGASAVYGSDAVAGVVNFVLDREFTGVKGEVSGGMTNYGDERNYKAVLSGGFGFASGRGHVLLSAEYAEDGGTDGDGGRKWNKEGWQQMTNPQYTATNGQPQQLFLDQIGHLNATYGGLVTAGPLKGTAFGEGGKPYMYNYGVLQNSPYIRGGDWRSSETRHLYPISPPQTRENLFSRISYDLSENVTAFAQYSGTYSHVNVDFINIFFLGNGPLIQRDNAYLPDSVRAAMVTANVTNFRIGTLNMDMPLIGNDTRRYTNRYNAGLEGTFNAGGAEWNWNGYIAHGVTRNSLTARNNISTSRWMEASDAVINPATGAIVCRTTLTNPGNGCSPWNALGTHVNADHSAGYNYFSEESWQRSSIRQTVYSASLSGEPFSNWAGPVSVAASAEYRRDSVVAIADPGSLRADHPIGAYAPLDGRQSVKEAALETVVPLAHGKDWAEAFDLNAAVRYTDYSLAGDVVTWKIGATYSPVDDIRFRVTRSRDIRAPNIQELFQPFNSAVGTVFDPQTNTNPAIRNITVGNSTLGVEKADTTGIGVVVQPSFIEGFTASVDYWNVSLADAIASIGSANVVRLCFDGTRPDLCSNVIRTNGVIVDVYNTPINLAKLEVRGLDFEGSYRLPLDSVFSDAAGDLSFHGNMTVYLRNYSNNGISTPTNRYGENSGGNPPNWKLTGNVQYNLDPITVGLTARAFSSGVINATYIECQSGCPTSTLDNTTINDNSMPGAFYLDANINYRFSTGDMGEGQLFFSVKNILNKDPVPKPSQFYENMAVSGPYDVLGAVFRAGVRFRM